MKKNNIENPERRNFMKAVGIITGSIVLGVVDKVSSPEKKIHEDPVDIDTNEKGREIEKEKDVNSPLSLKDSFVENELPLDLKRVIEYERKTYEKRLLSKDDLGYDFYSAINNIREIGINKITEPFVERNLEKKYGFLIPIKESWVRNDNSPSGAVGLFQIMPGTVKLFIKNRSLDKKFLNLGANIEQDAEMASILIKDNQEVVLKNR